MESPTGLTSAIPPGSAAPAADLCPRCGEPAGAIPPVASATLGGRSVFRCSRCGTRSARSAAGLEMIFTCGSCGLPFAADRILPHTDHLCPDCREGIVPESLPDAHLSAATEGEIRAALATRWRFVTSPGVSEYLDRIARQVALRIEGAPRDVRVVLVDDRRLRTLALPSGTLLISLGAVEFLEDEAELAFLLGHEIAHAASEDAAVRMTRIGQQAAARGGSPTGREGWAGAALDLVRLGYGRKRERDADLRAVEALLALRYEPYSALRFLARLGAAIGRGDPSAAEIATAHPPAEDRIRRIEKSLYGRVRDDLVPRVNREVFRRAAGRGILSASVAPVSLAETWAEAPDESPAPRRGRGRRLALAALLVALLGLAGLAILFLAR